MAHVMLAQRYKSPLVGLLLPCCSVGTRLIILFALACACNEFYYQPKQAVIPVLSSIPSSAPGEGNVELPLLGDIEQQFIRRPRHDVRAMARQRRGLQWPMCIAQPALVFLHSLGSTVYVAPTMVLCIGCLRAVTFGDPGMIVWLRREPNGVARACGTGRCGGT